MYVFIRDSPRNSRLLNSGNRQVRTAEVLSRIYSPTNPTAIDVYLTYHHRTRYESVEYSCSIYYRTHRPVTSEQLDLSTPEGRRKMHGFRPLLQMGLVDTAPGHRWRVVEEQKFDVSAAQARTLHRLLFGKATKKTPGLADKVGVRDMLRLLLASVGIAFHVAESGGNDRDRLIPGDLEWDGIEGSESWLEQNIRRVA